MTDREPASMSDEIKPCVIWECIYDHGNGKFMGEASRAQRERAFAELRRLHAEAVMLRGGYDRGVVTGLMQAAAICSDRESLDADGLMAEILKAAEDARAVSNIDAARKEST